MHAIKHITHACDVPKAIKLFRCVVRIIATIEQGVAGIEDRESDVVQNKPATTTTALSRMEKPPAV
jgi:hypothetical protein